MGAALSDIEIPLLLKQANSASTRFCRQHTGEFLEQDDVRQDLLLDLLTRLRSFDPARSSLSTFAAICFQHRTARLGIAAGRDRRARHPAALDASPPGRSGLTLLDTTKTEEGYGAWVGQDADPIAQAEQHHDLDRALSSLNAGVGPLCAALLQPGTGGAPTLSRTTVHRRVQDLRCRLLAAGVTAPGGTSRKGRG